MSSARESKEGSILTGHMETYNNSLERVAQKGYSDLVPHHLFLQHYDFFEHLTELESILGGNIPTVQRIKCLEAVLSISATPGASLHECVGTLEFHACCASFSAMTRFSCCILVKSVHDSKLAWIVSTWIISDFSLFSLPPEMIHCFCMIHHQWRA